MEIAILLQSMLKEIRELRSKRGAQIFISLCVLLWSGAIPSLAQQKGQWIPGQCGLNAGIVPEPGFTYQNLALNYSAGTLTDSNGNAISGVTGTYQFWVEENIFMYVPKYKSFGAHYAPFALVNFASGSPVVEIPHLDLNAEGAAIDLSGTFVEPVNLRWQFSRADLSVGYGFFAPTGRYAPGATNNTGSGYWGNHINSGTTLYITKNKGTSGSPFVDWESHGKKSGTDITLGQAFATECGLGQVLPLDKDIHKLLQIGFVGYDQWQETGNKGADISQLPCYWGHAMGFQTNFVAPEKGLNLFFKFYEEYRTKAAP